MTAQWQGLLKNVGVWSGSFANFSSEGELIDQVPSQLTLDLSPDEQTITLCLKRFPSGLPVIQVDLAFQYPGPGLQVPFFEQGAFSQGALQYSSVSRFGAELSMIWGDRRLRLVQQYPTGQDWTGLTLICETRNNCPPSASLEIEQILGEWEGEAQTLFADYRDPVTFKTHLCVEQHQNALKQYLQLGDHRIESTGTIRDRTVDFKSGMQPMRLVLLPGGGSSLCPRSIQKQHPFFLEAGWMIQPHLRQRLIRRYRATGEWESITLVTEKKRSD